MRVRAGALRAACVWRALFRVRAGAGPVRGSRRAGACKRPAYVQPGGGVEGCVYCGAAEHDRAGAAADGGCRASAWGDYANDQGREKGRCGTGLRWYSANTTNTWPTIDPSQLTRHNYGTGLLAADQVRAWVLRSLKLTRTAATEATAVAILDKLRTADFRDLYPGIVENLVTLKVSSLGSRVHDMFNGLDKIYPPTATRSMSDASYSSTSSSQTKSAVPGR